MPAITPWDVRIVSATTLATVAYVPNWHTLQFGDNLNDPGSGRLEVDYDDPWLSAFHTANSKYPWEGNYAIQVHRSGTLVYTFLIEEAEIEYAGNRRRAVIAGRGLAACLEWAIVLPEKFDEGLEVDGLPNPDNNVGPMNRAFGATHADLSDLEDIEAGQTLPNHGMILAESRFGPKYKAFGGGAFAHLFNEANSGVGTTTARWVDTDSNNNGNGTAAWANVTLSTLPGGGGSADRDGDSVDWPLSLDSNMTTEQYDSEGVEWSHATYEDDDTQWVFEVPSGQDLLTTLKNCASKTANAQWRVAPDGKVSIAKQLGENKSGVVLLTVPNAVRSANSFRRTDLRTTMFLSNGFVMEKVDDATAVSAYGRREAFVNYDNVHGEANVEVARQSLNEVKDVLDNFSFQYVETDNTQAWLDFGVADVVRIEYTPGSYENRQVVGISANLTPSSFQVEVTIGDVVENIIGRLEQVGETEQYTYQISQSNFVSSAVPNPPINVVATPQSEGRDRRAVVTFDQPRGWENEIATFEVEVAPTANTSRRYTMSRAPDRTSTQQEVVIHALASGSTATTYQVKARSISKLGHRSDYSTGSNFSVDADPDFEADLDGTIIDTSPSAPGDVANLKVLGMLNSVLVSFTDLNDGNNLAMQANRGRYEIQISNATTFNETSGNEWERIIQSQTSGFEGDDAQTFTVPSGDGFICAGLLSEAGGRNHWIRVRAIDWNKQAGDWVYASDNGTISGGNTASPAQWPVVLDTENLSQTGVIIGTDTIYGTFIKAGQIDATHIQAGTINASLIDAGQVLTSAIRMPQPANAENATPDGGDNSSEEAATFQIDKDGNVWWGDYDFFDKAGDDANSAFHQNNSYISAAGNARFVGEIGTDVDGQPRLVIGDNATEVGVGGSSGSGGYAYLLGYTEDTDEDIPGHAVFTTEGSGSSKYGAAYLVAPRFHSGTSAPNADQFKYAGVRLRDPKVHEDTSTETNGEAILVHPADMDYMGLVRGPRPEGGSTYGAAYSEVMGVVTAPGGLRITGHNVAPGTPGGLTLDNGQPATGHNTTGSSRNKLWNSSGTIMWGATDLTAGGSSYSWNLGLEEIEDGDVVAFGPEAQSGTTNLAWITQSEAFGVQIITVSAAKTITTRTDTGRNGMIIETASSPSTGVQLELNTLADTDVTSGVEQYIPWSTSGWGLNLQYKTTIEQLGVFIASLSDFQEACDNRQLLLASGTNAAPAYSFDGDSHSGIYRSADNEISFTFANSLRATMNLDGLSMVGGSATKPGYNFLSDTNTGMWRTSSYLYGGHDENWGWAVGGTPAAPTLYVHPGTPSWAYYLTMTSTWQVSYTSSAARYKERIETVNASDALTRIKALRPVEFYYNPDVVDSNEMTSYEKWRGFVSDEMAEVDHWYASYGWYKSNDPTSEDYTKSWMGGPEDTPPDLSEAEPANWRYDAVIADLVSVVQTLEARIAVLEG